MCHVLFSELIECYNTNYCVTLLFTQNESESPQLADGEQVDGASKTTEQARRPDVSQASNDDDEAATSKGHAAIAGIGSALSKVATGIKGLKVSHNRVYTLYDVCGVIATGPW